VLARELDELEDLLLLDPHLLGDLPQIRVTPELALEVAADSRDLVDLLGDVDGETDDASLLRDAAADRLPHPPRGVRGELEALGVVELLDSADQSGVPFLDEVQQGHRGAPVLAGD